MPAYRCLLLAALFCLIIHPSPAARADDAPPPAGENLGPFGVGSCYINNRSTQDNARWIPQMAAIGLRYYRAAHTDWGALEPEQGKWNWDTLDKQMTYLADNHLQFGGTLIGNARWNKTNFHGGLPINNLPAWSAYVSAVVSHAKGKIKYWEVWNEPPNFTAKDQTPADYARIVVAAYDAAKAADPSCLIGLAAKSCHVNYIEQAIKAGAKDHFDYITLHPYEVLDTIVHHAGTEPVFMHIVPTVRKMLAAQNPAKANVPVIFTELGCDARKGADVQAHTLIKAYAMAIAQGVSCVHWFEGRDGDSGPMGLLDNKGAPRPACNALAQLIRHLGQHPAYLGWVLLNDKHYGFIFQTEKSTALIAWAYRGQADQLRFSQPVQLVNPLTGDIATADTCPLTTAPILAINVPADLLKQAQDNKTRPLPWAGDYANADSVSITMAPQYAEKGLHTLSGDAVAAAVAEYGGSGRAGNIPGGNMFVVDPSFLSYDPTPIEITAVVRRNANNDNAGFNLVYESTQGLRHSARGWYTIPDNKQWHTVHWKIDDAQFVNYWGYNFSLSSDGNVYNKYYIQSITIKKQTP